MLSNIKLILFDLDNTLFPFDEYWSQATTETFFKSYLTKHLPYHEFLTHYKYFDHHLWLLHQERKITLDELRQKRLIETLKRFDINIGKKEANDYFHLFFERLLMKIKPNPDINAFLKELKSTYNIGIITNGKIKEQTLKIEKLRLNEVFQSNQIFISEEIGFEKPQVEAFHIPLSSYKTAPEQALFIGDSWNNDIKGAISAGMSAIWINLKGERTTSIQHKPLKTVEDILELNDLFILKTKKMKNT